MGAKERRAGWARRSKGSATGFSGEEQRSADRVWVRRGDGFGGGGRRNGRGRAWGLPAGKDAAAGVDEGLSGGNCWGSAGTGEGACELAGKGACGSAGEGGRP